MTSPPHPQGRPPRTPRTPRRLDTRLAALAIAASLAQPAGAHPHVFVDGGIDFTFGPGGRLEAIRVTWRYDAFETLYMLTEMGVMPTGDQGFTEDERRAVEAELSVFADDFDGSAHLSIDGAPLALAWPTDVSARMAGDRLEMSFTRTLETPVALGAETLSVAFYERTYFFAFSLTDPPGFSGDGGACRADIAPFEPSSLTAELQATLAKLSREEVPEDENVGAVFADRMTVTCG